MNKIMTIVAVSMLCMMTACSGDKKQEAEEKPVDGASLAKVSGIPYSETTVNKKEGKNVLVISSSPRRGGNTDLLADEFVRGAKEAGGKVEKVFLADIKSERTLSRKLREMIYALKIERTYTKDEILEAYLNTIYLGYGCYGINAAAHTYFGKDVQELNLAESAALAALPQAPDSYALLKDEKDEHTTYLKKYELYANEICSERRDLVLDLMEEQGYISSSEANGAKQKIAKILHPHIDRAIRSVDFHSLLLICLSAQNGTV